MSSDVAASFPEIIYPTTDEDFREHFTAFCEGRQALVQVIELASHRRHHLFVPEGTDVGIAACKLLALKPDVVTGLEATYYGTPETFVTAMRSD